MRQKEVISGLEVKCKNSRPKGQLSKRIVGICGWLRTEAIAKLWLLYQQGNEVAINSEITYIKKDKKKKSSCVKGLFKDGNKYAPLCRKSAVSKTSDTKTFNNVCGFVLFSSSNV